MASPASYRPAPGSIPVDPGVYRLGRLVYSNPAVDVIELSAPTAGEAGA